MASTLQKKKNEHRVAVLQKLVKEYYITNFAKSGKFVVQDKNLRMSWHTFLTDNLWNGEIPPVSQKFGTADEHRSMSVLLGKYREETISHVGRWVVQKGMEESTKKRVLAAAFAKFGKINMVCKYDDLDFIWTWVSSQTLIHSSFHVWKRLGFDLHREMADALEDDRLQILARYSQTALKELVQGLNVFHVPEIDNVQASVVEVEDEDDEEEDEEEDTEPPPRKRGSRRQKKRQGVGKGKQRDLSSSNADPDEEDELYFSKAQALRMRELLDDGVEDTVSQLILQYQASHNFDMEFCRRLREDGIMLGLEENKNVDITELSRENDWPSATKKQLNVLLKHHFEQKRDRRQSYAQRRQVNQRKESAHEQANTAKQLTQPRITQDSTQGRERRTQGIVMAALSDDRTRRKFCHECKTTTHATGDCKFLTTCAKCKKKHTAQFDCTRPRKTMTKNKRQRFFPPGSNDQRRKGRQQ